MKENPDLLLSYVYKLKKQCFKTFEKIGISPDEHNCSPGNQQVKAEAGVPKFLTKRWNPPDPQLRVLSS